LKHPIVTEIVSVKKFHELEKLEKKKVIQETSQTKQ